MGQSTTYTILARHEPASANTAPCVNSVESLMSKSAYDLSLVGHSREFALSGKEIIAHLGARRTSARRWRGHYLVLEREG